MDGCEIHVAVDQNQWDPILVGRCTTHVRHPFQLWDWLMFTGGTIWVLTHGHFAPPEPWVCRPTMASHGCKVEQDFATIHSMSQVRRAATWGSPSFFQVLDRRTCPKRTELLTFWFSLFDQSSAMAHRGWLTFHFRFLWATEMVEIAE